MTFDGPFPVYDRSTGQLASGVHYNCDQATYDGNAATLAPYRATPAILQRVFAGDDPASPQWTVALVFPDQATADQMTALA